MSRNDRNEQKPGPRVSIKELAELIGVSTDTIRRAFRKGEIPTIRVRTARRFDLDKVRLCMQQQAETLYGARPGTAGGNRWPRAEVPSPRTGNTGARTTDLAPLNRSIFKAT